jgi:membrane fusion protein, copper/silver efflux system
MGVSFITAMLLIQNANQGWPFSLRQNVAKADSSHSATPLPSESAKSPAAPSRVTVVLNDQQAETIGLRTEAVKWTTLDQTIRAVATVVPDESRVTHMHTRVSGWVEELYVTATGQTVRAGEPVAAVYSQDLYATQIEYLAALKASSTGPSSLVVEGARNRLKLFGMTKQEIAQIERDGEARKRVTVVAPHDGIVIRRNVSAGTAIDPSTEILTVADLRIVWVFAEIPEGAAKNVIVGSPATLQFPSANISDLKASIDFVYPMLTERTRTLRVRFIVPNPDGVLRPGLYGTADIDLPPRKALLIPRDAVVDTGQSQHVFVSRPDGSVEPRKVQLGVRLPEVIEIASGLDQGELVVASGVFLLDSESRLRASSGSISGHGSHGGGIKKAKPDQVPMAEAQVPASSSHSTHEN